MNKLVKKTLLIVFLIASISACSNENKNEVEEPIEPNNDVVADEETADLPYTYPLTGVGTEEQLDRRVVAVTINNHPAARPQSGVIDADVVYEVLAEGEMTRFVALFHSKKPERVGPVRSMRPYFIELANGYDAMLVTHGWSPEAEQQLKSGRADYLNGLYYDGTLFKRSSDRKAPHNSYITFDNILEGLETRGYELTGNVPSLSFYNNEDSPASAGTEGKEININYYNRNIVDYQYNDQTELYERFNDEKQTVDYETNEPIEIANLFIVEATHRVLDDVGRRAIDLDSGGEAILFQNGIANPVKWENRDGLIVPVQNGEQVPLKPGQTWINIVPTSPGIESSVTYQKEEEVSMDAN